jgi:hypothetical protein
MAIFLLVWLTSSCRLIIRIWERIVLSVSRGIKSSNPPGRQPFDGTDPTVQSGSTLSCTDWKRKWKKTPHEQNCSTAPQPPGNPTLYDGSDAAASLSASPAAAPFAQPLVPAASLVKSTPWYQTLRPLVAPAHLTSVRPPPCSIPTSASIKRRQRW